MAHAHYDSYRATFGNGNNPVMQYSMKPRAQLARPALQTLDDLTNALLEDIEAGERSTVPECTTSELTLSLSALVPLHTPNIGPYAEGGEHDLPAEYKINYIASGNDGEKQVPQATAHSIIFANGQEARQTVQRAASRGIIAAIEKVDGFKYSFNNAWAAKDDDGMRFSYICQDSTQNKDRHANGFPKTQKHLKGAGERGPRKETFDCKGSVSVKCSFQKGSLEVFYRHYAIHPKVKERKPYIRGSAEKLRQTYRPPGPMRPPPDQNSSSDGQTDDQETGGLFGKLQTMKGAYADPPPPPKPQAMAAVNSSQASNIGRPLKRKREDEPIQVRPDGKVLSLAEILKQSQTAKPAPKSKQANTPKSNTQTRPPPMEYSLPSWQMPTPAPPAPPAKAPQTPTPTHQPQNLPPSYQQPYQPYPPQASASSSFPAQLQHGPRGYRGQPGSHPKSQGLFTTMKQVPKDNPIPSHHAMPESQYYPGFVSAPGTQAVAKARSSCTNCRYGKKKCDEARPICSACARVGRYDCQYEGQYMYPVPPPQQPQQPSPWSGQTMPGGAPVADMRQHSSGGSVEREESPDPWFPKR